jgi:signal transduction histidine kinase
MLHEFLKANRKEILALTEAKTVSLAGSRPSSDELKLGLPLFYDQLITFLENQTESSDDAMLVSAARHGKELLHLGYTLSHVVHAYGAMCQAITEYAQRKHANIAANEFNDLNRCLDVAIASAVSEYQFHSVHASQEREVEHLGSLVHELRNALSSATVAHEMIKAGMVGTGGSTAKVLEDNLARMRILIDQIVLTARIEGRAKNLNITCNVDTKAKIESDRQLLLSGIANLVQNAIKYTKGGGSILITGSSVAGDRFVIEVQDECGGLPSGRAEGLFKPFTQEGLNQTGLGLGLTISRRAISLLQGKLTVRNNPGAGCVFIIEIPKKLVPAPSKNTNVAGKDSVQPDFKRSK